MQRHPNSRCILLQFVGLGGWTVLGSRCRFQVNFQGAPFSNGRWVWQRTHQQDFLGLVQDKLCIHPMRLIQYVLNNVGPLRFLINRERHIPTAACVVHG